LRTGRELDKAELFEGLDKQLAITQYISLRL